MGLMLSVIVFCVGVAEVWDCWHHILYHLVQPQYNSLPFNVDSRADIISEKELHLPSEPRRPSHVDISWPKDLSPNDDLHIIKKRSHSESERHVEHDTEGNRGFNSNDLEMGSPNIVVHCSDTSTNTGRDSPVGSRDGSPDHLGVIIESESSSEVDEPSQIENLYYEKAGQSNIYQLDEDNCDVNQELRKINNNSCDALGPDVFKDTYGTCAGRPTCPSSLQVEASGNGHYENCIRSVQADQSDLVEPMDLPVFTDNILSRDVKRISCQYAQDNTKTRSSPQNKEELKGSQKVDERIGLSDFHSFPVNEPCVTLPSEEQTTSTSTLAIEAILDEGLEPISEFPEIRLTSSSPSPPEDSSESVNTSDASFFVKSKTSDRPLIVRFSPTSEDVAQKFKSVTQTDLQAFGSKSDSESHISEGEGDNDLHYIAHEMAKETQQEEGIVDEPKICEVDNKDLSVNVVQLDTNSSSSSLSGIPQLPEDVKDTASTSLPTDNGFRQGNSQISDESLDISNLAKDGSVQSLTSDDSEQYNQILIEQSAFSSSEEKDIPIQKDTTDSVILESGLKKDIVNISLNENKNNSGGESSGVKEPAELSSKRIPAQQIGNKVLQSASKSITSKNKTHGADISPGLGIKKDSPSLQSGNKTDIPKHTSKGSEVKPSLLELTTSKSSTFNTDNTKPEKELPSKDTSSTTSDVVSCQAKRSDEEDHVDHRGQCVALRTSPSVRQMKERDKEESEPSTSSGSGDVAGPSKCSEENKAFWLIFSGEYTKAMNKDWHSGHFCCWQCDESLTGQRYVLRDDHPYCIKCYESVFANGCEECNKTIGIDSKDLSYKDKHWHEACFLCNKCRVSLVDKQFGSKLDKIFCGNCYDAQFASRCDGCGQIFKAGTKKMEYKMRQWHEPCFSCCVCKSAIGTKSFIPREQEIYCATCYEEKFATRCVKCDKIITTGGVTYKNEPWHRECFTCTNCNTSLAGQRFTSRDEKPYCAECFGELFAKRCTACCKPITGIGGTRFISFEDRHWHNDCFICASCKTSLVGRGFITDAEDIICPECAKQKLM